MSITNPVLWTQPLGYAADANEIPVQNIAGSNAASFQMIFPVVTEQPIAAGGIPPARADFNGLFKLLGDNIYFLQRGGFYQYDATIPYDQDAIVLYNGLLYKSLAGDNEGHEPGSPTSEDFWEEFIHHPDLSDYARLSKENTFTGINTFTAKIIASGGIQANLTGNVTGNAATATRLATARKISITGDGTGSTTFDGSADRSITFTLDSTGVTAAAYGPAANATLKHSGTFTVPQVTVDAKGRVTAAATRTYTLPADSNTDTKVTQTVTTTNDEYPVLTTALNDATANRTEGVRFDTKVKINHSTGTVTAPKFNGPSTSCTGNAATATRLAKARNIQVNLASTAAASFNGSKNITPGVTGTLPAANGGTGRTDGKAVAWATARTITLGGDLSGSVSMDGSANVTLNASIKDTGGAVPVGAIIEYMGQGSVPSGYLLCNGANVSRTTYANLFKAIGTKFGKGDGSTTFTLPNGKGRYMQGTTGKPGKAVAAGLPNITGSIGGLLYDATANGAFSSVGLDPASTFGGDDSWNNAEYANFRASYSSSIYGSSGVTPNSYSAQYLIKY